MFALRALSSKVPAVSASYRQCSLDIQKMHRISVGERSKKNKNLFHDLFFLENKSTAVRNNNENQTNQESRFFVN